MKSALEAAWKNFAGERAWIVLSEQTQFDPAVTALKLEALSKLAFKETLKSRFLVVPEAVAKGERDYFLKQWWSSRAVVASLLEKALEAGESPEVIELSLSHCKNGAEQVCLVVGRAQALGLGVGVDIEATSRSVSAAAAQRFVLDDEPNLGLTPLQIWVIKEACYKANPYSQGSVLPQYRIKNTNGNQGTVKFQDFRFEQTFSFRVLEHQGFTLGFSRTN